MLFIIVGKPKKREILLLKSLFFPDFGAQAGRFDDLSEGLTLRKRKACKMVTERGPTVHQGLGCPLVNQRKKEIKDMWGTSEDMLI